MTQRQQCIDLLYADSTLFLTREQFEKTLDGWEFDPVLRPDGSVGILFLFKGPEFHFAKFGADVAATRAHLNKYPGSLIAQYGYALTRTPKTDTRQQRFNLRLGFFQVGEDDWDIHYRIDHLRKKESPCQQSQ